MMVVGSGIVWLVGHGCCTSQLYMWRRSVQIRIDHLVPLVGQVTSEVAPRDRRPGSPRSTSKHSNAGVKHRPRSRHHRSTLGLRRPPSSHRRLWSNHLAITTQRALLVRHRPQIQKCCSDPSAGQTTQNW